MNNKSAEQFKSVVLYYNPQHICHANVVDGTFLYGVGVRERAYCKRDTFLSMSNSRQWTWCVMHYLYDEGHENGQNSRVL